ncbi:hypothetical protein [Metabacillus indicus]|uniref:hypothetical protein n=1 Tax=Metabacillus indicus TaxID=246786 RepID=UPI003CEF7C53
MMVLISLIGTTNREDFVLDGTQQPYKNHQKKKISGLMALNSLIRTINRKKPEFDRTKTEEMI